MILPHNYICFQTNVRLVLLGKQRIHFSSVVRINLTVDKFVWCLSLGGLRRAKGMIICVFETKLFFQLLVVYIKGCRDRLSEFAFQISQKMRGVMSVTWSKAGANKEQLSQGDPGFSFIIDGFPAVFRIHVVRPPT